MDKIRGRAEVCALHAAQDKVRDGVGGDKHEAACDLDVQVGPDLTPPSLSFLVTRNPPYRVLRKRISRSPSEAEDIVAILLTRYVSTGFRSQNII